jgi:hypothetical protein
MDCAAVASTEVNFVVYKQMGLPSFEGHVYDEFHLVFFSLLLVAVRFLTLSRSYTPTAPNGNKHEKAYQAIDAYCESMKNHSIVTHLNFNG